MDENTNYELMYRRPDKDEHENLTKVIDDILNRLNDLEDMINTDTNPGLTD